jgi:hypothetical protein
MRTDGQSVRHDKANNLFSKFCEHALKYQGVATSSDPGESVNCFKVNSDTHILAETPQYGILCISVHTRIWKQAK